MYLHHKQAQNIWKNITAWLQSHRCCIHC